MESNFSLPQSACNYLHVCVCQSMYVSLGAHMQLGAIDWVGGCVRLWKGMSICVRAHGESVKELRYLPPSSHVERCHVQIFVSLLIGMVESYKGVFWNSWMRHFSHTYIHLILVGLLGAEYVTHFLGVFLCSLRKQFTFFFFLNS